MRCFGSALWLSFFQVLCWIAFLACCYTPTQVLWLAHCVMGIFPKGGVNPRKTHLTPLLKLLQKNSKSLHTMYEYMSKKSHSTTLRAKRATFIWIFAPKINILSTVFEKVTLEMKCNFFTWKFKCETFSSVFHTLCTYSQVLSNTKKPLKSKLTFFDRLGHSSFRPNNRV